MFWFVLLGLYASCCAPGGTASKSAGGYRVAYEEDLSVYRNAQEFKQADETPGEEPAGELPEDNIRTPELNTPASAADISDELQAVLDSVALKNKSIKTVSGYTILVYSGASRDGANQAKRRVYNVLPEAQPELKYIQPNYKVQVGEFIDRLEAQRTFAMLKSEFPSAQIVPERIRIN
jgi:hypothetical protein